MVIDENRYPLYYKIIGDLIWESEVQDCANDYSYLYQSLEEL